MTERINPNNNSESESLEEFLKSLKTDLIFLTTEKLEEQLDSIPEEEKEDFLNNIQNIISAADQGLLKLPNRIAFEEFLKKYRGGDNENQY